MTAMDNELEEETRMEVMVLTGLAAICKKLVENSRVPEELQVEAREFVKQYDSLVPYRRPGHNCSAYARRGIVN